MQCEREAKPKPEANNIQLVYKKKKSFDCFCQKNNLEYWHILFSRKTTNIKFIGTEEG